MFLAYAGSRTVNRIMESYGWGVRRLGREAAAYFDNGPGGLFHAHVGGEKLGIPVETVQVLLRRDDHWESSSRAMRRAGW